VKHYILDASHHVIEADLLTWGRWFGQAERRPLARTEVRHLLVLTSFLGIDVSFGDGEPAFFETKVLDGMDELECTQHSTWTEALDGHDASRKRWSRWAEAARCATERSLAERC
jgi:hypothetical protein